jgi:hypothetical protein
VSTLSLAAMRAYLATSITSLNQNKLNGLLAEVELRNYLTGLGYEGRISRGGWLLRTKGPDIFGNTTIALFPEILDLTQNYPADRILPTPDTGLFTIGATFQQCGIPNFFCAATVAAAEEPATLQWNAIQLGLPVPQQYTPLVQAVQGFGFTPRTRNYSFLRYDTDATGIPDAAVPEEFTKEHLRIAFHTPYMAEISDIDGLFWGNQFTYPMEIKEKTAAPSTDMGAYFGLDVGPFAKLAFYAARRGNLRSLYVVREIDNTADRNLVGWLYITFEDMVQRASWGSRPGGTNMLGGASAVVRIPRAAFRPLNAANLAAL